MTGAAVAVIGGGVMGASVAYHLAALGQRDVVILDRADAPGAGSTGRATGGYRAQYGTAINVRLSLLAREKLRRFADETGVDPGYAPAGYLWLAASAAELDVLRAGRAVQHAEGLVEAEEVSPQEIARINPAIRLDGVAGGAFCPTDGFIRPLRILEGYLAASARLGVRQVWAAEVRGFRRDAQGRIVEVETARERLPVGAVVNAAGPWAASVAALAGVALPVTPLRRQIATTMPCDLLPADMPMTIWAGDGFHLRVRDGRVLLLWPTPGVPGHPFEASVDPAWVDAVVAMAHAGAAPGDDRPGCLLGGAVRDVAGQARDPGRGGRVSQSVSDQRLVWARGDARAGAGAAAGGDHLPRAGRDARRDGAGAREVCGGKVERGVGAAVGWERSHPERSEGGMP
jgi:sarcosine oxidase subunit beta